jgi:hypothetical protein
VREVGPDDVVKSDMDPHERTTCHRSCGRPLYYVGPEGNVNQNFGSRGLERKASLKASLTETLKPRVSKSQSDENESFENLKIAKPNESSENLFESKYLSSLFILACKC